jgi:hypothetical protein
MIKASDALIANLGTEAATIEKWLDRGVAGRG